MGLFDRRKREEPKPDVAETEPDELDGEEEQLDGPATWYRTMDLTVVPAGDDVLLHDPERAAPVVLPAFELDLLAQCTHFAPVEAHAAAAERRTGLPAGGVAQRLYELVDRGLLVSQQEVLARARAAAEADTDAAPTLDRVAVITSDRPASLATCLRSYRERYGADIELIVFDDSADAATRAENRRVAAQAAAGGRISLRRRGREASVRHRAGRKVRRRAGCGARRGGRVRRLHVALRRQPQRGAAGRGRRRSAHGG